MPLHPSYKYLLDEIDRLKQENADLKAELKAAQREIWADRDYINYLEAD